MCITTGNARLSGTIVGAWDIQHPKFGYRHVLAYQNRPSNLSDKPNCMLLHIPAAEVILPEHIVDTSKEPASDFLEAMVLSKEGKTVQRSRGSRGISAPNFVHKMGIYHIAILNDPAQYQAVLAQIPEDKRPDIPEAFIDFYRRTFYQYPLLLCCFNNRESEAASPIVVHFAPKESEVFMLPVIEAHGTIPQLGTPMYGDRTIVVGSCDLHKAKRHIIKFNQLLPEFQPKFGFVEQIQGTFSNADILIYKQDLLTYQPLKLIWHILPFHVAKMGHVMKSVWGRVKAWWHRMF